MLDLNSSTDRLEDRHKAALNRFHNHRGQEHGWPAPLPDGTLLANKSKGIYMPAWTHSALSVRQSLGGGYQCQTELYKAYTGDKAFHEWLNAEMFRMTYRTDEDG